MLCPSCKFRNPKGSVYCHNCGRTFAAFHQSSQWDKYSTSEDSGAYRQPVSMKTSDQASIFEEDADAMSTTQEIPRWDSMANAPLPSPPAQQPPGAALDYDGEQSIEEVSASYDNTFLRKFMTKLSSSEPESELDTLSSTARLPKWDEQDASISVSRKSSQPPPPPPHLPAKPQAAPRPPSAPPPPAPVKQRPSQPVAQPFEEIPVIEQPPSPTTDADLPSVQIADHDTGKYPTYPPAPPASARARPAHPSGNKLAVVLICILAVIMLLLGASAVLLYLIKSQPPASGPAKTLAILTDREEPETPEPAASKPKEKKMRPAKKETGAAGTQAADHRAESQKSKGDEKPGPAEPPKKAETAEAPVQEPAALPEPPPRKAAPVEVKNLNPLLNDPPTGKLVQGKIFSQGHVIELGSGTFAIERPAKVYAASVFAGKIPSNRALVDVEIALTGSANPKQYKVFIIDARGEKRGPNSSVENYLILPKAKNEVHKLWKKSSWVPEKETHLLHRGFLVPDNAASSFIIEIKGPKGGKVLWFKIAEQTAE